MFNFRHPDSRRNDLDIDSENVKDKATFQNPEQQDLKMIWNASLGPNFKSLEMLFPKRHKQASFSTQVHSLERMQCLSANKI